MTTNGKSGDAAASPPAVPQRLTLRIVISRHKGAFAGAIALLLVLVAATVLPAFVGSSQGALSDSATCSEWGSASQAQLNAYSHLYLNEYGALLSRARSAGSVRSAISSACLRAAYLGEADEVSVVAAIKHRY